MLHRVHGRLWARSQTVWQQPILTHGGNPCLECNSRARQSPLITSPLQKQGGELRVAGRVDLGLPPTPAHYPIRKLWGHCMPRSSKRSSVIRQAVGFTARRRGGPHVHSPASRSDVSVLRSAPTAAMTWLIAKQSETI